MDVASEMFFSSHERFSITLNVAHTHSACGFRCIGLTEDHMKVDTSLLPDKEVIPMVCKWVPPQSGINNIHFR